MAISVETDKERVSEGSWDGSAGRFTDAQYESSCVLDRKVCDEEWADKPPKTRCSLPIKEPGGELSRAGVHAAASRIGQVEDACPQAIASAKAKLRSAYKKLGEDPPDSLSSKSSAEVETGIFRDRALASMEHEWQFREEPEDGYLGILTGHFAVFNRWTEIDSPLEGHFMERVAPGAFARTFSENRKNMRVLLNHGKDPSVGLKPLGPIRELEEDSTGAAYEVGLLDTSYNRDLLPGLREGLFGASFRFQIRREDFVQFPERSGYNPLGLPESTIREAKVKEFGPVTFGQYDGATAGLRSLNDDLVGLELNLMARSDPQAVAEFARIISSGFGSSHNLVPFTPRSANVGTTKEDGERNDPTSVDYGMLNQLKWLKASIAEAKGTQLTDPDDDDSDDDAVMSALNEAEDAIDKAIVAQAADCRPDDGDDGDNNGGPMMAYSEEESEDDKSREEEPGSETEAESEPESEPEAEAEAERTETETSPKKSPSTLADRAPVRGPTPPGATLKKRAALLTTHKDKEPVWKL